MWTPRCTCSQCDLRERRSVEMRLHGLLVFKFLYKAGGLPVRFSPRWRILGLYSGCIDLLPLFERVSASLLHGPRIGSL